MTGDCARTPSGDTYVTTIGAYMLTNRRARDPLPSHQDGEAVAGNTRIDKLLAVTVILSKDDGCMSAHVTKIASPLRSRSVVLTCSEAAELCDGTDKKQAAITKKENAQRVLGTVTELNDMPCAQVCLLKCCLFCV